MNQIWKLVKQRVLKLELFCWSFIACLPCMCAFVDFSSFLHFLRLLYMTWIKRKHTDAAYVSRKTSLLRKIRMTYLWKESTLRKAEKNWKINSELLNWVRNFWRQLTGLVANPRLFNCCDTIPFQYFMTNIKQYSTFASNHSHMMFTFYSTALAIDFAPV